MAFRVPELRGPAALGLDGLLDFHFYNNADYPFARLTPRGGGDDDDGTIVTWREMAEAVHRAGRALQSDIGDDTAVVAILAPDDGLVYTAIQLAIIRIGLIPLSISTRNSTAAISHLISATHTAFLVVPHDQINAPSGQRDAIGHHLATLALLAEHKHLTLVPEPTPEMLFPRLAAPGTPFVPDTHFQLLPPLKPTPGWKTLLILHSSGTTKFPKPIYIHKTAFQEWLQAPYEGAQSLTGKIICAMAYPKFHAGGVEICMVPTIAAGTIAALFYPALANEPVPRITSESVLTACIATGVNFLWLPPLTITEWSKNPHSLKFMQDAEIVMIGGAPLGKEIGDRIVRQGVRLASVWGSTEVGYVVEWPPRLQGLDWQWQIPRKRVQYHFEPLGDDLYEVIIQSCTTHHPSITRPLTGEEPTVWESHDVAQLHPTRPGVFRVLGRTDDQIMLSNAEKTNPGPMEEMIESDPRVRGALMFGRGKPFNGVLIEPSAGNQVPSDDTTAVHAYLDLIWPSIEAANALGPTHSRLVRELVIVLDPRQTPLPRTAKHTVIRQAAWRAFASEIEEVYAAVEDDDAVAGAAGAVLTPDADYEGVRVFVGETVGKLMDVPVVWEDRDLFVQGCDSLKATFIRQAIQHALNKSRQHAQTQVPKVEVPQLIVYEVPTVQRLATWVHAALHSTNGQVPVDADAAGGVQAMRAMADKYSLRGTESTDSSGTADIAGPRVILITGTTGALGCHMLQQLALDPTIQRIYAMGRASDGEQLRARQRAALLDRGLATDILDEGSKIVMLAAEGLVDIAEDQRDEMRRRVTHVFHVAYPLNFNLGVRAFEPQVAFVRALVDFCGESLRSVKPRVTFASSAGTLQSWRRGEWVTEERVDVDTAVGTGYGESKRVCEMVLESAAASLGLEVVIVRIGQLCGSRATGDWNASDWVPMIVASCTELSCLPDSESVCAWLRTDTAASGMIQLGLHHRAPSSPRLVYRHLVHPHATPWHSLMHHLSTLCAKHLGHTVDLVPAEQWVDKVRAAALRPADATRVKAVKLMGMWAAGALATPSHPTREVFNIPRMETRVTEAESSAVKDCPPLSEADADRWFQYWLAHGLFSSAA